MRWPPFAHVFLDCDSTLSSVEGIDVLASAAGKSAEVRRMTDAAMDGEIDLDDVYGARLAAVNPTRRQVAALRQAYKANAVDDAAATIAALTDSGVAVYVISGGLLEPVREFALALGVPADRVAAVSMQYDVLAGEWWSGADDGGLDSPYLSHDGGALTASRGKADVIRHLLDGARGRVMLVGDGMTDLRGAAATDLFVAFSGVAARPRVVEAAPVELSVPSLAPVLALALGPPARERLTGRHRSVFERGMDLIDGGGLRFRDAELEAKFAAARTR